MEPSCKIFEDLINSYYYISYTFLDLSHSYSFSSNLFLSRAKLILAIMYHMPLVCFCFYTTT